MKPNRLFAFSLPSLAALFVVMPHTRPIAVPRIQPAVHVQSVPCSDSRATQASVFAISAERFANDPYPHSIEMGSITGSCWMSEDEMIFWNASQLQVFSRKTQRATPIARTSADFTGEYLAYGASLSPDSRWLVRAGSKNGHFTWEAITIDGTEHRQWPREQSSITPAVAWMQDSTHWVEICCPETRVNANLWCEHPENLQARVYSTITPEVDYHPLALETPEPGFTPPTNNGSRGEFIFTQDGRAWLSKNWQGAPSPQPNGPCSRDDVYELVPGPHKWTFRRSYIYPTADSKRWMFDSPRRSPDGNWIAWRNYAPDGKDKLRLMLSRTDGSAMQEIYQGDTRSGFEPEWSPDSRQIAFTDNGPLGIVTVKIDPLIAQAQLCSPDKAVARVPPHGKFPVAHPGALMAGRSHPSAVFGAQL